MLKYETDSRIVKPGQIFVAIPGYTVDGHDFIEKAIENGASGLIVSKDVNYDLPTTKVDDTSKYLTDTLVKEYSNELKDMKFIGITGTNGKTTTCYLIYQLLRELNVNAAYLGTIGFYHGEDFTPLNNTTPDILTLYKLLLGAKEKGCTTIVMEVSSHALSLKRIAGLNFDVAGFTNITQDHLDYHKTMEEYLKAKLQIVDYLKDTGVMIVNNDDEKSADFKEKFANNLSIGLNKADIQINEYKIAPDHTTINFNYLENNYEVTTNLTSKFNVYNYLFALTSVVNLGFDINSVIEKTKNILPPKGRCETYKVNNGYAVIDYAHTPDAVEKVIDAYNELKNNRIITIVGCGGDRDPMKRPIMGKIASENSDYVVFTNDNPRTENQEKIMQDIMDGVEKDNYEIVYDRREAIKKAISIMEPNDIVLILGKGHEDYQIIGHEKVHLDDSEEVKKYI